jgi:predicted phage baseplate assembly protein
LDTSTGRITFGDGVHGRVPPIDRDVILAVRYRQGGGATANAIEAWNDVNLVTPLLGVERVLLPIAAAGGADPQDGAATIRFAPANVAMRTRALTLADFESLALQFAPDVAQARTLPTAAGIRVIVAVRGANPTPSRELRRALRAHLLAAASPTLAAGDALRVDAPRLVTLHVELRVVADASMHSGSVARAVGERVRVLLDPATGGIEGAGWRLGEAPTEADVAAVLADVEHLERIDSVGFVRVTDDGVRTPLDALRADQLLTLAPDGVHVHVESAAEVAA